MLRALRLLVVSLLALAGPAIAAPVSPDPVEVSTDNETPVLYDDEEGGNASGDDPAIWVHRPTPARAS
jgi:3-phytase